MNPTAVNETRGDAAQTESWQVKYTNLHHQYGALIIQNTTLQQQNTALIDQNNTLNDLYQDINQRYRDLVQEQKLLKTTLDFCEHSLLLLQKEKKQCSFFFLWGNK